MLDKETLLQWMNEGYWEEAHDALEKQLSHHPDEDSVRAWAAIVKNALYRKYQETLLRDHRMIHPTGADPTRLDVNLDPSIGYILSLLTMPMTIADLLAVGGMSEFEIVWIVGKLRRLGLVEFRS